MRPKSSGDKGKKDHQKIRNKVGVRKVARNETSAQSVSSKRIVLPVQSFGPSSDVINDSIIGLRHFNSRKRIDAINALNRLSPIDFGRDKLVSVLICASYALSDDDQHVRQKCSQLIIRLLSDPAISCIGSISDGIGIHLRSSLSNVKVIVRRDSMVLLEKLLSLGEVFDESGLNALLMTLLQLGSTIVHNQQYTSEEDRSVVKRVIVSVLEKLLAIRKRLEQGQLKSGQWCIASILSVLSNTSVSGTLHVDMSRYLAGLRASGDKAEFDAILSLSRRLDIALVEACLIEAPRATLKKSAAVSGGGVFSRMARLAMQDDSDS